MPQSSRQLMAPDILNEAYEDIPIAQLKTHPRNVNQGDLGAIYESISENGFYGVVIVQRSTGYILAGNHRFMAAKQLDMPTVPAVMIDVDDERALRIMLADNRTTRLGNDDPAKLAALLSELSATSGQFAGTGYSGDDLDEMLSDLAEKAPPTPKRADEANQLVPSGTCPHCGKAISIK